MVKRYCNPETTLNDMLDVQHNNLGDDITCIIVANKVDKPERVITTEMGKELANRLGMNYIETSAKTSHNVEAAYNLLVGHLREQYVNVGVV